MSDVNQVKDLKDFGRVAQLVGRVKLRKATRVQKVALIRARIFGHVSYRVRMDGL
jgi:hypothetical protein